MFEQIVILDQTGLQDWALEELEKGSRLPLRIYETDPVNKEEVIGRIGQADCVFLSWRTKLSSEILNHCNALKYIGMCCSLYSPESANVDIEYASQNGIVVKGIRDYGDEGVVEYVLSELIRLIKGLGSHQWKKRAGGVERQVHRNHWIGNHRKHAGKSASGTGCQCLLL